MRAVLCQIDAIVEHFITRSRQGDTCRANVQRLSDKFEEAALQMREELKRRGPSFLNEDRYWEDYTDGGAA